MQASQQINGMKTELSQITQNLKSAQANNRKQAEMLQAQKAAVSRSPELVHIEKLEEAVQQAQEVLPAMSRSLQWPSHTNPH